MHRIGTQAQALFSAVSHMLAGQRTSASETDGELRPQRGYVSEREGVDVNTDRQSKLRQLPTPTANHAGSAKARANEKAPMLLPAGRASHVHLSGPTAAPGGGARTSPNERVPMFTRAGKASHVRFVRPTVNHVRWARTSPNERAPMLTRAGKASHVRLVRPTVNHVRRARTYPNERVPGSCRLAKQATSASDADGEPRRQSGNVPEREGADVHARRQGKPRVLSRPMASHAGRARASPNDTAPMFAQPGNTGRRRDQHRRADVEARGGGACRAGKPVTLAVGSVATAARGRHALVIRADTAKASANDRAPMSMPAGRASHVRFRGRRQTTPAARDRPERKHSGPRQEGRWIPPHSSVVERSECPAPPARRRRAAHREQPDETARRGGVTGGRRPRGQSRRFSPTTRLPRGFADIHCCTTNTPTGTCASHWRVPARLLVGRKGGLAGRGKARAGR